MPGVLIIEGMAQTAGVLCLRQMDEARRKKSVFYLLTVDKAKFRKPAVPGDTIHYHVNKSHTAAACGGTELRPKSATPWSPRPKSVRS